MLDYWYWYDCTYAIEATQKNVDKSITWMYELFLAYPS